MKIYKIVVLFLNLFFFLNGFASHFQVEDLSLEEKVGQLLMVHFNGSIVNDDAKKLINQAHVGGFIYYRWSNGLTGPNQVYELSKSLQDFATEQRLNIPLLIAIDQEGGFISTLRERFTRFPDPYVVGQTDASFAKKVAVAISEELRSVGINLNLGLVVDVYSEENPFMKKRTFGKDAKKVAAFGKQALDGYNQEEMFVTLKHFPGHGGTTGDSHVGLPLVSHTQEQLDQFGLYPYFELANQTKFIMTAHLFVPSLDNENCATFSKKIVQGLLRDRLHFHRIIMTDSLVMKAIGGLTPSIEEAAIRSLESGHDIILLGGKQLTEPGQFELQIEDILKIHKAIVDAVKQGRITEKSLNESVQRILEVKKQIPSLENKKEEDFHYEKHRQIAEDIEKIYRDKLLAKIGSHIWYNECKRKIEGLTWWNQGEEFASLGIGHFLWYPEGTEETFHQTFPELLVFLEENTVKIPDWLKNSKGCPWKSREEFMESQHAPKMVELRTILADQIPLQVAFMFGRLNNSLNIMISKLEESRRQHVMKLFERLSLTENGLYALIDYVNFKGEGIQPKEKYNNQGWGLLQVLESMPNEISNKKLVEEFVHSAKDILVLRVKNSPPERNEQRWLKGWHNRLDTYLSFELDDFAYNHE